MAQLNLATAPSSAIYAVADRAARAIARATDFAATPFARADAIVQDAVNDAILTADHVQTECVEHGYWTRLVEDAQH